MTDIEKLLEATILRFINSEQGLRGVELAVKVMSIVNPSTYTNEEYDRILNNLVNTGEIVEIDYVIPNMEYRVKSIYFPKGTIIDKKLIVVRSEWKKS